MEWDVLEHSYNEKTNDWYASAIIIAAAIFIVVFMGHLYLLATLIFIGTITFLLLASRRPNMMHVEIRPNGIRAGDVLYPYQSLDGFAIIDYTPERRLLLESNHRFMPLIVIHMPDDLHPEDLHVELIKYIPEKTLHESLPQLVMEWLGF